MCLQNFFLSKYYFTKFHQNKGSLLPSPPYLNVNHVIRYKGVCINFSDLLTNKITPQVHYHAFSNSILLHILHWHTFALIIITFILTSVFHACMN